MRLRLLSRREKKREVRKPLKVTNIAGHLETVDGDEDSVVIQRWGTKTRGYVILYAHELLKRKPENMLRRLKVGNGTRTQ